MANFLVSILNGILTGKLGNKAAVDPYQDKVIGYWHHKHFVRHINVRTAAGFKMELKISGHVRRVDDAAFKTANMVDDNVADALVDTYCCQSFIPLFEKRALYALGFGSFLDGKYGRMIQIFPHCYTRIDEDQRDYSRDPNARDLVAATRAIPFEMNGCTAEIVLIESDVEFLDLIEENFAMLTPEEAKAAVYDERYSVATEYVVVAALKKIAEIKAEKERLIQEIESAFGEDLKEEIRKAKNFKVSVLKVDSGRGVKLTVSQDGDPVDILGYITQGEFSTDPYSQQGSGQLIFHTCLPEDSVLLILPAGTHRFTFISKTDIQGWSDWTRCTVQILSPQEAQALAERRVKALLPAMLKSSASTKAETLEDHWQKSQAQTESRLNLIRKLLANKKKLLDNLRADPAFSDPEDQVELERWISGEFQDSMEQLKGVK